MRFNFPTLVFSCLTLFLFGVAPSFAASDSIVIQGNLGDMNGDPLTGTRSYRIQFFDNDTGGNPLGSNISGQTEVSPTGRFSIELIPPPEVFAATDVYYQMGVDSAEPPDGSVDPDDAFPNRVKVNSTLFAQMVVRQGPGSNLDADMLDGVDSSGFASSSHTHNLQDLSGAVTDGQVPDSITVDRAVSATRAMGLTGSLTNPGDQVSLADNVILQVGSDGEIEFLVNGKPMRLVGQKWFDPTGLADNISPDGQDGSDVKVALNNKGEGLIAWRQTAPADSQLFRSQLRNGTWIDPSNLADNISPDGTDAEKPEVANGDNGDAIIVWEQEDNNMDLQVFRSEYRNGTWSDPANLDDNISPDGQAAEAPQVAMNNMGEAIIVWSQSDGTTSQIFRSEYRNDSWTDPVDLMDNISPAGQNAFAPRVAMNEDGEAVIAWHQFDGTNIQIFRSEYRAGSWTDPSGLNDSISPGGQDAIIPIVAMDNNGDAIIGWRQSDGANTQVFRSEHRNGSWTDPSDLMDNNSPDGETVVNMRVAMGDNGEAVIVWSQFDGAINRIFRSEYRNNAWTDPADLNDHISPDGSGASIPDVAMNNRGESIIVWQQTVLLNDQIFRSEYRDGAWIDLSELNEHISPGGQGSFNADVAIGDDGSAVIVWTQNDGMNDQQFRSEYRFGS